MESCPRGSLSLMSGYLNDALMLQKSRKEPGTVPISSLNRLFCALLYMDPKSFSTKKISCRHYFTGVFFSFVGCFASSPRKVTIFDHVLEKTERK